MMARFRRRYPRPRRLSRRERRAVGALRAMLPIPLPPGATFDSVRGGRRDSVWRGSAETPGRDVTTLAAFLRDRIDEDEAAARAATQGVWKLWGMTVMADQAGTGDVDDAVSVAHSLSSPPLPPRTWNAAHIARHDPARVLADVAAKRAVLADHHLDGDVCVMCKWQDERGCPTLRHLATVYSGHPDYRPEWTV